MDPVKPIDPRTEADALPTTLGGAFSELLRNPFRLVLRHWNWKAALLSALVRTAIFFAVNLTASWSSAVSAVVTELLFRAPMVGTLASVSQAFRRVEPAWKAGMVMMVALPALGHSIEFTVHSLRGTEKLYESVAASVAFSMCSCVLSYLLHRRDVLIVGEGARPLLVDLVQVPGHLLDLVVRKPLRLVFRTGRDRP